MDKLDFDRLLDWVERRADDATDATVASTAPKLDLCCHVCGYGIVSRVPPERCPMCGAKAVWGEPLGSASQRAALHARLAG